jgi:hypothetical protein
MIETKLSSSTFTRFAKQAETTFRLFLDELADTIFRHIARLRNTGDLK